MPRQGIHARQAGKQGLEGQASQSPVAEVVRAVGTGDAATRIVHHAAALRFGGDVGRTEVIDHHDHHDEGQGDGGADDAHRGVEAVLEDKIQKLFHTVYH